MVSSTVSMYISVVPHCGDLDRFLNLLYYLVLKPPPPPISTPQYLESDICMTYISCVLIKI